MNKIIMFAFLMIVSSGAMADLVLTISTQQKTDFKKTETNKFEKVAQSTTGLQKLEKIKDGSTVLISEKEINKTGDSSKLSIEVTGDKTIKIEDDKEQISAEVEAKITRSLFGKLKAIKVDAKNMDNIYAEAYKRSGMDILKKLKIGKFASSEITTSDLKCNIEANLLKCEQDQEIVFTLASPY